MCNGWGAPRSDVRKEVMVVLDEDDVRLDWRFDRSVVRVVRSVGVGCPVLG